jgi:hypothetical protein
VAKNVMGVFAAMVALASPARAQVHWDASAQVGVMKRFLADRPRGGSDAGFGPVGEIHGHIAILPLLRVGPYVSHDIMPAPGDASAYQITSVGGRAKVTSPFPQDPWRIWGFIGFGYAGVYGPSYHTNLDLSSTGIPSRQDVLATGAGGSFFEVPFGIGVSYKLRRPWHLTAELSGRAAFGFTGSLYNTDEGRAGFAAGQPQLLLTNAGTNPFGLGLALGVMVDL